MPTWPSTWTPGWPAGADLRHVAPGFHRRQRPALRPGRLSRRGREALWAGECSARSYTLGERSFPYFALPLTETDWLLRAEHAIRQVSAQLGPLGPETPLFVASSSFQIGYFEQQGAPFAMPIGSASFSRQIAEWMGLRGARHSFSNACVSGFSALDAARTLMGAGWIDEAIVLGIELANASTLAGFAAMELLSPDLCRPLDAHRDGLVLGEAVAAIRLSATPSRWKIAGQASGLDGYLDHRPRSRGRADRPGNGRLPA